MADIIEEKLKNIYDLDIAVEKSKRLRKTYVIRILFGYMKKIVIDYEWAEGYTIDFNIREIVGLIDKYILLKVRKEFENDKCR